MIETAVMCMALNIWHEARLEPLAGQMAVALVTKNRARESGRSICREVYRPHQFSWTDVPRLRYQHPYGSTWPEAVKIAHQVLKGEIQDFTGGATYYHTIHVHPPWRRTLEIVGVFGTQIFYRR